MPGEISLSKNSKLLNTINALKLIAFEVRTINLQGVDLSKWIRVRCKNCDDFDE